MNLYEKFEQNVQKHPNKPAFIYFDKTDWKTLTYKDIFDQTQRFFFKLAAGPWSPGMTAALMTPPNADFFPFALALLKFGIVPIILDPAVGLKEVGEILHESRPDIFIGNRLTRTLRFLLSWGKDTVKHNLTIEKIKKQKSNGSYVLLTTSHSSAAIIYTSGSTGLPKGAIYTHANLAAQLDLLQKAFDISTNEIDLPAFPLYALIDLLLGVTSVIPDMNFPVPGKTNPQKVITAIQQFNVTNMFASPVMLEILSSFWNQEAFHSHEQAPVLRSLKRVITAGAPATITLQKRFRQLLEDRTDLFGVYGATETLPIAKVESREIFALQEKTEHGAGICLGKPIEDVTVRIIPISDTPIPEWHDSLQVEKNVVGEITVQSPATTRTYLQREDANRLSKIKNGDEVIHRMGDVGYFDEEGRLWYCGRKSHRVITKQDALFTEQIENIFNAHDLVHRTALVEVDGLPVLWVELERNAKVNKTKITEELKSLAVFHSQASQIQTFLFIKKFPTDVRHNSKIIREKLTELATRKLSRRA